MCNECRWYVVSDGNGKEERAHRRIAFFCNFLHISISINTKVKELSISFFWLHWMPAVGGRWWLLDEKTRDYIFQRSRLFLPVISRWKDQKVNFLAKTWEVPSLLQSHLSLWYLSSQNKASRESGRFLKCFANFVPSCLSQFPIFSCRTFSFPVMLVKFLNYLSNFPNIPSSWRLLIFP